MDRNRKTTDKWISAILSIILPGVGHLYLGFVGRGLIIIGAFVIDISLLTLATAMIFIVFPLGIALVTLLGLVLPVIYFFSIFDALQMAERKHTYTLGTTMTHVQTPDWQDPVEQELDWPEEIRDIDQTPHTKPQEAGLRSLGIVLVVVGVLLMISFLLPGPLLMWLLNHRQALFATVLLVCGVWLIWRQWDRKKGDHS